MSELLYERLEPEFFVRLVDAFYADLGDDPRLRPMYPDDLGPGKKHLADFLTQYFGGPRTYEKLRGEPKLRLRHLRFVIDQQARDAWMSHMTAAVHATTDDDAIRDALLSYFDQTSTFLMNQGLSLRGRP